MDAGANKNQGCKTSIGNQIKENQSGSRIIFWNLLMTEENLLDEKIIKQISQLWIEGHVQMISAMTSGNLNLRSRH